MISETHNRLFDNLLKTSPDVLKRYLQEANLPIDQQRPGTPPLYLVAAALQGQREKALAGSPQPGNQPTVAQQLVSEAAPPPTSQMPGPPQLPPAQNPPAPAPIEQGIAALPTQEPNYAHGGVVSFAGGDFIEGFGELMDPEDPRLFTSIKPIAKRAEEEPELTPEEIMRVSGQYSTPYRDTLKNWGGGDMTPPARPAAPPADPLAGADVSLHDPRQEFLNRLRSGLGAAGTGGGAGGGFDDLYKKYSGVLSGPAAEMKALADEAEPKEMSETLARMQEARRLAGVNQGAYDAQRAKEMADYESDIAKNVGMQERFAKAKAWGALADTKKGGLKGLLSAASNAMNTYAEGMTGVMNYDTENKMLLRKLRMAQADQDFARKFNDSNALLKAREEEENARRELKIKAIDVGARSNAAALRATTDQINAMRRESGANARQSAALEAGLIKSSDAAKTQLAQIAARFNLSMAQVTSRNKKDRYATALKLRENPLVLTKAREFAQANPNMKVNGKLVDPVEYFINGYTRDWFNMTDNLNHAATSGSFLSSGPIDVVETEEDGGDSGEFDWDQGY